MYIILTEMDSGNIMLVLCGLCITLGCCIGCCVSGHKPLDIFKEIFILLATCVTILVVYLIE